MSGRGRIVLRPGESAVTLVQRIKGGIHWEIRCAS